MPVLAAEVQVVVAQVDRPPEQSILVVAAAAWEAPYPVLLRLAVPA
jgi:hypothetical protein